MTLDNFCMFSFWDLNKHNRESSSYLTCFVSSEIPLITNQTTSSIFIIEGEAFQISCSSVGKPAPAAAVKRNGRVLAQSNNGSVLLHKNISTRNDEGLYECQAINLAGEAVQLVKVQCMLWKLIESSSC